MIGTKPGGDSWTFTNLGTQLKHCGAHCDTVRQGYPRPGSSAGRPPDTREGLAIGSRSSCGGLVPEPFGTPGWALGKTRWVVERTQPPGSIALRSSGLLGVRGGGYESHGVSAMRADRPGPECSSCVRGSDGDLL